MKIMNKKTGVILDYNLTLERWNGPRKEIKHYISLAKLNEEWEDTLEEPKVYWYIDDAGVIQNDQVLSSEINMRKSIGNYFETKGEAEEAVEKLKALKRLKDNGFKFIGKTYDTAKRFGSIFYKVYDDTYSEDIIHELYLLFGDEE